MSTNSISKMLVSFCETSTQTSTFVDNVFNYIKTIFGGKFSKSHKQTLNETPKYRCHVQQFINALACFKFNQQHPNHKTAKM